MRGRGGEGRIEEVSIGRQGEVEVHIGGDGPYGRRIDDSRSEE
jgi:hypothetical protein